LRVIADGGIIDTGARQSRRGLFNQSSNDNLIIPNRPLKRGENLLEIWDRSQAKKEKSAQTK